ncbi:MAG: glycosyltransferase N-terminal domain-containing protein [Akkermansiaceae bacterium]|nr:glycosyltransferase N-terminal domain-containing protein [Akkermansiaceae bacterium]
MAGAELQFISWNLEMRTLVIIVWRILYPLVALAAAPFWMLKMLRRDGWGSGLLERIGIYGREVEFERTGAVYIHAVSVGEVLLALKVITEWRKETGDHFVLVPTTATGMAVARDKAPEDVRVIYAPLDLGFLIRRVMKRLEPRVVVMVESEIWPNLIYETHCLGIPIGLMNARLSPRSGRRLKKFQSFVAPFLELLDYVGVPEKEDLVRWQTIGVREKAAVLTGNVKFDPSGAALPEKRPEFSAMLDRFPKRPVAMAVSTFPGEEEYLDDVFRELGYQSVIVPRHAERRAEVVEALNDDVILRSEFQQPLGSESFVIDSTGELRDWTAHADVVVIGKSFFEEGGQNPSEAILAGVPVICGSNMANFEPLVSELKEAGGICMVSSREELVSALRKLPRGQVPKARAVLEKHNGAMERTISLFRGGR